MPNKNRLFYISWVIAIALYSIIPITIGYLLVKQDEKAILYTAKAETYYTIELAEVPKIEEKLLVKKVENKPKIEEKKILKQEGSLSPKEKTDFKSLFSNLNTEVKEVDEKPKEVAKKRTEIASRKYGQKQQNKVANTTLNDIVKKLDNLEKSTFTDKSIGEYNEYYAKIKTMLTTQFNSYMKTKSDNSATAIVIIDNLGNFDYKLETLSNSSEFNKQLKEFLDFMRTKKFPPYTQSAETQIEIEFKTEE
jgi:hypothetical protein